MCRDCRYSRNCKNKQKNMQSLQKSKQNLLDHIFLSLSYTFCIKTGCACKFNDLKTSATCCYGLHDHTEKFSAQMVENCKRYCLNTKVRFFRKARFLDQKFKFLRSKNQCFTTLNSKICNFFSEKMMWQSENQSLSNFK